MLAHRGLATDAPENTLLAFLHAVSIGVTHLETDVHASSDGVAMISHDPDLRRLTGRDVLVGELTAAELRAIDLGHGQNFCSLAEALDAFPDAKFNIDIKDKAGGRAGTIAAILKARADPRVLIGSFSTSRRRATVKGLPGVATSISMIPALFAVIVGEARPRRAPALDRCVESMRCSCPRASSASRSPRRAPSAAFHAAGVEVHAWTINDPDEMRELLDAGIDGLVTRPRPTSPCELLRRDRGADAASTCQSPVKALKTAGSRHFHGHPVVIPVLAVSPDSTRVGVTSSRIRATQRRPHDGGS